MTAMGSFQCCCCCIILICNGLSALECDPTKFEGGMSKQQKYECLVQTLFDASKYSPLVRPAENINTSIDVQFSIQLSQIISLDEKNQVMKTNVWLQLYWTDYQLKWNDSKTYGNIEVLRIRPEYVWRPDVVLFNNADGNYEVSYMSNCLVYKTGEISWIPPAIYKSSCRIDVQFFPFDEQVCDMKFGSWTFLDHQLTFSFFKNISIFDVSDYLENGAWDIVAGDAKITKTSTGRTNEYKSMVTFRLRLRRKTLFYTVNLIIPCVLISFVTLSVFILPADAGEKITLCISILLALVVFLLLISKILPPSLTIPLISQYLLFTFIMNILAIVSTVIVINRNYRTPRTHHMPYWIRLVFLNFLPKIMFMKRPDHDQRWNETPEEVEQTQPKRRVNRDPDLTRITTMNRVPQGQNVEGLGQLENFIDTHHPNCRLNATSQGEEFTNDSTRETITTETSFINKSLIPVSKEIYKAAESVKFIHNHLKKDDEYHTVIDDWRYVARVFDRLLLTVFLAVTIFGSLGIFMKAPHILQSVNQNEILAQMNAVWAAAA